MKFRGSGVVSNVVYENIIMDSPEQWSIWIGPLARSTLTIFAQLTLAVYAGQSAPAPNVICPQGVMSTSLSATSRLAAPSRVRA